MSRSRGLRRASSGSISSSTSTSPERGIDDDNDSFMMQGNDSQSSLGLETSLDASLSDSARREYEERCRVSPVHRLPAELLISIFSRLNTPSDLQSCMLVSKEWARNSVGLLWHRPAMSKWPSIQNVVQSVRKADKFFAYQDLVKRLNMSTLGSEVSDGTLEGMYECKRIERLTLTNCNKLTDGSLSPLIDGNRSLLALDVTGLEQLTDKTMMTVAENCLRLQGLNVTGCKRLTDASISAIAKNCRHLKRLKFNNCVQLTDTSIMTIAANSSHLLEIDLYGLANLESPAVTALLTSCTHLREMRLAHCVRLTDAAFLDIPHEPELPITFESLRILDLTDCNELGDKGVERIVQTCPRLRNLILAKCRQITDRAVFAITKLGKNLHFIHLGHCARITDVSVEALAKACNRIRYIDLACCINLTDNSVMKLASLPKLKRIGLVKCAVITDRSIYALAMGDNKNGRRMSGLSVLERVHLSYCTLLTLEGIHALLNNCPKLTHLSLTGVQAFLREELLDFCRDAPPEFNEHQRDVFCVFSGPGVGRLRDYLNQERKRLQPDIENLVRVTAGNLPGTAMVLGGGGGGDAGDNDDGQLVPDDFDDDDDAPTPGNYHHHHHIPLLNIDVHGNHAPGGTPVLHAPSPPLHPPNASGLASSSAFTLPYSPFGQAAWQAPPPPPPPPALQGLAGTTGGPTHLSQSAPASTGALWGGGGVGVGFSGSPAPEGSTSSGHAAAGPAIGAQHVTGMMGATILDEVDEGDEAFGEDSEIMGD